MEMEMISKDNVDILLSDSLYYREKAQMVLAEIRKFLKGTKFTTCTQMLECEKQIVHYSTIIELCEMYNCITSGT